MAIRNQNFYNLQLGRNYPLSDTATCTGDNGERLPSDILADCHLRFPELAGRYAYLGGVTITDNLVTMMFLGADTPEAADNFTPLAVITLTKPITAGQHYSVRPLYPGVGGWVVLGDAVENFVGRFSTPQQSLLLPKCARWYRQLPVPSLGKLHRDVALTGLVRIRGGSDIEVVREVLELDGDMREALVVRLIQNQTNRNVLQDYIGPCGKRPESGNCVKPGVEFINTVGPDCDGNINIDFLGVSVGPLEDCGPGITLDHSLGLDEACEAHDVPTEAPRYDDLCEDFPYSSAALDEDPSVDPDPVADSSSSEAVGEPCAELPYCTSFNGGSIGDFVVESGSFAFQSGSSPGEICGATDSLFAATAAYTRNVALWDNCATDFPGFKSITTDLQLPSLSPARNGGIVANYRYFDNGGELRPTYFIALVDHEYSTLRLLRFNGSTFVLEAVSSVLPIVIGHWYRLNVLLIPLNAFHSRIRAQLTGITDPTFPTTTVLTDSSNLIPLTGLCGLGSNSSSCLFGGFKVEDA